MCVYMFFLFFLFLSPAFSGLTFCQRLTSEEESAEAGAVLSPYAASQHALCLSQVNNESYQHSAHTNTSLQNTLPTMPFGEHLRSEPSTLPFYLVSNTVCRKSMLYSILKLENSQETKLKLRRLRCLEAPFGYSREKENCWIPTRPIMQPIAHFGLTVSA